MYKTIVETRYGKVEGTREGDVTVWRGIPYARPPVGSLRFCPPQPPLPWDGVMPATAFKPICPQVREAFYGTEQVTMDEDCLYLNIWSSAADDGQRPVMVWIHGGAFVSGSGQQPTYDGHAFAEHGDVVLVTFNYRLGPLGFLELGDLPGATDSLSSNAGLEDQLAVLRWIGENITAFGGDPSRVTVFGESAGAMSIGALLMSPAASGLFHGAILQSGVPAGLLAPRTLESARSWSDRFRQTLGCADDVDVLRRTPTEHLAEAAQRTPADVYMPWRPTFDGKLLSAPVQDLLRNPTANVPLHKVPLMVGTNLNELALWTADGSFENRSDEGILEEFTRSFGSLPDPLAQFYTGGRHGRSLIQGLVQLGTYSVFVAPTLLLASYRQAAPVWVYRFDWQSTAMGGVLQAAHAMEIPFVFHTFDKPSVTAFTGESPDRAQLSQQMHAAWIAFAHHQDPNTAVLPTWPPYDAQRKPTMVFDTESRLMDDPFAQETAVWRPFLSEA